MLKRLLITAILGSAIVGCSSTQPPAPVPEPVPAPVPAPAPAPEPAPLPPAPVVTNHNSVYFGFNKYNINDDYTGLIKANADVLAKDPGAKVQVIGNTDDIGSVEYNLALGQKRANAVKKVLIADGTSKSSIETTSNGKLKQVYTGGTPDDQAKNRRADIVYISGQPSGYSTDSNGLPIVTGDVYNGMVTEGVQ